MQGLSPAGLILTHLTRKLKGLMQTNLKHVYLVWFALTIAFFVLPPAPLIHVVDCGYVYTCGYMSTERLINVLHLYNWKQARARLLSAISICRHLPRPCMYINTPVLVQLAIGIA